MDKLEIQNSQKNAKHFDLEDRTFNFTKDIIKFIHDLPKTVAIIELSKQLVRSAGSIGANYIEANGALGRKDFLMRIKICRKEAKETIYWLKLINRSEALIQEATELSRIFSAILQKFR